MRFSGTAECCRADVPRQLSSNSVEEYRLAAGYVDRILHGEKPAELPVQAAMK
jgi:hypothetical protein